MLVAADLFFFVFHTLLILFNMLGWAWQRTRRWHLATMLATAFSWFILGIFYGWGYCVCTDWHFQVRRQLGYVDPDRSYIQLLVRSLTGQTITSEQSDWWAGGVFLAILIAMLIVWWQEWQRWRGSATTKPMDQTGPSISPDTSLPISR